VAEGAPEPETNQEPEKGRTCLILASWNSIWRNWAVNTSRDRSASKFLPGRRTHSPLAHSVGYWPAAMRRGDSTVPEFASLAKPLRFMLAVSAIPLRVACHAECWSPAAPTGHTAPAFC